jgi:hypothetical protein
MRIGVLDISHTLLFRWLPPSCADSLPVLFLFVLLGFVARDGNRRGSKV